MPVDANVLYNEQIKQAMNKYGAAWFQFDEEMGNVTDSKGTAVGTIVGGATRVSGWNSQGYAMNFNGTNSYVQFNQTIIPTSSFTIRFKMKVTSATSSTVFSTQSDNNTTNGVRFAISSGGFGFYIGTGSAYLLQLTYSTTLLTGQWYDVMIVKNGTQFSLYVNDMTAPKSVGNTASFTIIHSSNLRIGNAQGSVTDRFFNGQIDDFQVYSNALSIIDFHVNKSFIYHDGEYKKIEQSYDYTNLLDTAITANSKLTNWFKFDEASGNVTNSKGTAVGTVTNAIRVSGWNGKGNAISFNGTNSYVQFNAGIIPLGEKSVRFKIKRNGNPSNVEMILSSDNYDSSKNGFRCLLNTDGTILMGAVRGIVGTSLFMLTSTISVCDDQWHDILLTWDGTTRESGVKLYIDDLFIPNVTATATTTAESNPQNNLCMGARLNSNGGARDFYFKGEIDSFETYNKVLTIDEIFEIGNKVVTVVSEEAPTVPQFISAMDSLDILTREVTSLELPMANKSEILDANDEGKVFGKTIDLKKYMDIRTINVEVE
jgi:Laminin G domain.